MNRALARTLQSGARRALRVVNRVARIMPDCVSACCGCTVFYRADSCEGIAYNPPPSDLCPALPSIYVCSGLVPGSAPTVIRYNGSCYRVQPGISVADIPDGAVKITDTSQFVVVSSCYDPSCNSNRFFYKATACAGESDLAPDFYVCVAGVPFDCAVFRFNVTPGDPATYCYRLDRGTPIDEDDIPTTAVRVPFVDPTYVFARCCECLSDCDSDTIVTAPCGDPPPTTTCCCNRNAARTLTYTMRQVGREGRDGFPGYFGVTTITTTVRPTLYCQPDGAGTITTTGHQTVTTVLWDGSSVTTEGDIELGSVRCFDCHPPAFNAPRTPCSGTAIENNQFGFPQLVTWRYRIGNLCTRTYADTFERVSDPNNANNFEETERYEEYTLEIEDNGQRCSGGCDGYTGVPLGRALTPAMLRGATPSALLAELRRLSRV